MEKLLIVGSELGAEHAILELAAREGYEVVVAAAREEALQALRAHSPLCLIVDHQLEDDDGMAVIRAVQRVDPACAIILVTAGGEMETAIQALRAGALDYLRKPIDLSELGLALARARERRMPPVEAEPAAVLVIEDHEPTRKRVAMVLEKEGYQVHAAADGAEGVALFRAKRVDVILADLRMPNMSGLEVLEQTKGKGADVEVIVITGYGEEDDVVRALRQGAVAFLKKPVDIEQMLIAIEKALEFQLARRRLARRNRDLELMQQLVVRLTSNLEIVVETPPLMRPDARDFLLHLLDCLPMGIVVAGADRTVQFVNRHVLDIVGERPGQLSIEWLRKMGVVNLTEEKLGESFDRLLQARPGTIETILLSRWAFLVLTPMRLVKQDRTDLFVALVIRGERRSSQAS